MIEIGKNQELTIARRVDFGLYLTDGEKEVLLPNKYVPEEAKIGDPIDVFVYTDSEDRPVATTLTPAIRRDEFAGLKVKAVAKMGAFLDMDLEKDLFVPFKEQHRKFIEGETVVVKALLDYRTNRMIGVSKVREFLEKDIADLNEGDEVEILIWLKTELGYNVIINDKYAGLVYQNETFEALGIGDRKTAFIKKLRADGKVDVALQRQGYEAVRDMSSVVLSKLEAGGGVLDLGDKSDPADIKAELGMSKKNFKKILGGLYKAGEIEIFDFEIRKK